MHQYTAKARWREDTREGKTKTVKTGQQETTPGARAMPGLRTPRPRAIGDREAFRAYHTDRENGQLYPHPRTLKQVHEQIHRPLAARRLLVTKRATGFTRLQRVTAGAESAVRRLRFGFPPRRFSLSSRQ